MVIKFSKDDYKLWTKFRKSKHSTISRTEFNLVCKLHSTYYKHKFYQPCTCSPKTIKKWIAELNIVWENGN